MECTHKRRCRLPFLPDEGGRPAGSHHLGTLHELRPEVVPEMNRSVRVIVSGLVLGGAGFLSYLIVAGRAAGPEPATIGLRAANPACQQWRTVAARFEFRAESHEAADLIRSGSVGLVTDDSGQLLVLVPSRAPSLWRVGLDGSVTPAADEDVVSPDNRPAILGPWRTDDGSTMLFLLEDGLPVRVGGDGGVDQGEAQTLPFGSLSSVFLSPDQRVYFRFDSVGAAFLGVNELDGMGSRYGPIPLPDSTSARRFAVAEGAGGLMVRQRIPYLPESHWVPLTGGRALWADGAKMEVLGLALDGAEVLYCDQHFVPAEISTAERDEAVARITWMNRFTDSTWTWNAEPLPGSKPAIERLFSWGRGNIGIVSAVAAEGRHPDSVLVLSPSHADSPRISMRDRWQLRLIDLERRVVRVLDVPVGVAAGQLYTNGSVAWVVRFDSVAGTVEVLRYALVE
jgi:hypothetical protein